MNGDTPRALLLEPGAVVGNRMVMCADGPRDGFENIVEVSRPCRDPSGRAVTKSEPNRVLTDAPRDSKRGRAMKALLHRL
jgi:hypothetical protein